eukprot:scaffold11460_cov64-Phaeocystis_antarctica.AAC.8
MRGNKCREGRLLGGMKAERRSATQARPLGGYTRCRRLAAAFPRARSWSSRRSRARVPAEDTRRVGQLVMDWLADIGLPDLQAAQRAYN